MAKKVKGFKARDKPISAGSWFLDQEISVDASDVWPILASYGISPEDIYFLKDLSEKSPLKRLAECLSETVEFAISSAPQSMSRFPAGAMSPRLYQVLCRISAAQVPDPTVSKIHLLLCLRHRKEMFDQLQFLVRRWVNWS